MSHIAFVKQHEELPFLVQITSMGTTITRLGKAGGMLLVSLSGAPEPEDTSEMLEMGVPVIDWRNVPPENGPFMGKIPSPAKDARSMPFDDSTGAPREVIASMARALGAKVYNLSHVNLHPKMFRRFTDEDARFFCGSLCVAERQAEKDQKQAAIYSVFDECEHFISWNDDQRESLEEILKQHFDEGNFSSDEHLKAVYDLKMHDHLDTLLSACWALIKYQILRLNVSSNGSISAINALRAELNEHRDEQLTILEGLDVVERKTQCDAIVKYREITGKILEML